MKIRGPGDFFAMRKRVNFYIDGFNFYHRVREFLDATGLDYRWLDYRALCESLLRPGEVLGEIFFFTAVPNFRGKGAAGRCHALIRALKSRGVRVRLGVFKRRREKMTDVAVAAQMVADACQDRFDACFLLSGDIDFVPAVAAARQRAKKTVGIVVPPHRADDAARRGTAQLEKCASRSSRGAPLMIALTFPKLNGLGLPPKIRWRGEVIRKPDEYAAFHQGPPS